MQDETDASGARIGLGAAALSAIAFGTVAPLVKTSYNAGADPFPLLAIRFSVAAALLAVGYTIAGRSIAVGKGPALRLMALGALGYAFEASLFFAALERAPAGVVTLVFYSYPMLTTTLAFLLRLERVQVNTVIALALGSIGVASLFSIDGVSLAGLLLASGAALAVALYFTVAGVVARGIDPGAGATWTAMGAALATGAAWLITGQGFPVDALPPGLALGTFTAVAFLALYAALALIGPARTTVAQMLEPVVTVTIAAVFLGEEVTFRILVGAALIMSSIPVLAAGGARKRGAPPAPDSI